MLFVLTFSESFGQTDWPRHGLIARWDIDKNDVTDIENCHVMEYDQNSSYKSCYDTLPDGRKALCAYDVEVPVFLGWNKDITESEKILKQAIQKSKKNLKYTILPDTFTIIVKYSLVISEHDRKHYVRDSTKHINKIKNLDSKLIFGKNIYSNYDSYSIVEADDGEIEIKGWIDTTLAIPAKYDIPLVVNEEDGTVWLSYSFIPIKCDKYGNVVYMEEIATQEGIYRCYKKRINSDTSRFEALSLLQFRLPFTVKLTDLAIYNRRMSVDEFKLLTGNDKIVEYDPNYDHSTYGRLWVVPAGVILLVLINLLFQLSKKNRPYKTTDLPSDINSRNIAMSELTQAWKVFGSRKCPLYPKSRKELKSAQKHLDTAVLSGCNDKDIVTQINEIGSLLNHSRSLYYYPKLPVMLSVLFAIFVCIGPLFMRMFEYSLTTHEFYLYYLTIASILFCGLTPRYVTMCGKAIPQAQSIMEDLGRNCIGVVQGVAHGVGTSIIGVIMSIWGVIYIVLSIFVGCIYDYVIICGNTVIATGVGGFCTGLLMVVLFGLLLDWAIPIIYGFAISVLIVVFPILCYIYCQYSFNHTKQ